MVRRADGLDEPIVVEIDDEFSALPGQERIRLAQAWLDSLPEDEPIQLPVSAARLLAEVRAEEA